MSPYPNAVFSFFAFLGFLMCAIPFPWHLEAWNTGTCLYMFWTGLACITQFANSIVWSGNAINWAPVWCDISARIIVGTSWAIPASSLVINRRLYLISSVQSVTVTKAERRRNVMVDLAIGMGLPIFGMIVQYIPQGHRFNIFEDVGCYPFTWNTSVAYPLVFCPPVAIGLVSAYYASRSIYSFNKQRAMFNELLSNYSNLTSSRYVRLMCLAGTEILLTVPLGSYSIYLNVKTGIWKWVSWSDTHSGFSRVDQILAFQWRADPINEVSIELTRWLCVLCAFVFFAYFGFADEARKHYRTAFQSVAKRTGVSSLFSSFSSTSSKTFTNSSNGGIQSKTTSSGGKIRPIAPAMVHTDFLRHQPSSISSLTEVSFGDVSGFLSNDEKQSTTPSRPTIVVPTLSYDGLKLSDAGGILADYKSDSPYSPTSSILDSPTSSSAPSLRNEPTEKSEKAHTHDMV